MNHVWAASVKLIVMLLDKSVKLGLFSLCSIVMKSKTLEIYPSANRLNRLSVYTFF